MEFLELSYFSWNFHKCHFLTARPLPPWSPHPPSPPGQKNKKLHSIINTGTIDLLNLTYEKCVYLYLNYQDNSFHSCCKYCYFLIK